MVRFGILFVLVLSLLVTAVLAQDSAPITTQGIPPFSLISHAGGGIDSINLGDLSLLLSIPINSNGPYGPKSSATLLMESGFPVILVGEQLLIGNYSPFLLQGLSYVPAHYSGSGFNGTGCDYTLTGAMDPSGAFHHTPTLTLTTCGTLSVSGIGDDGWQIACCVDGTGKFNFFTIAPDGTYSTIVDERLFDFHAPPNYITFTQSSTSETFADAASNETAQAALGTCCSGNETFFSIPQSITYPGPGNTTSTYQLGWNFWTGNSNANCGPSHAPYQYQETMPFLSSMELPDTSHYSFTYEYYWNTTNMYTGRIQSITLPTGATISYTYSGGTQNEGVWCDDGSTATIQKTTPDGTWTFTHCEYGLATAPTTCNTSPPDGWSINRLATTTVTEPSGDYKIYWTVTYMPSDPGEKVILPTQMKSFGVTGPGCSISAPCNLGSQVICYQAALSLPSCPNPAAVPSGAITERDVYTYVPGVASPSLTVYMADSYERPIETRVYGFGGARTSTNWDSDTKLAYGSWNGTSCATVTGTITGTSVTFPVLKRVCSKQRFVGGSSTAVSTSHYTYNATGDLVTQQDTIGGVLVTTANNQYDSHGRLTQSVGPNGETTSTVYNACSGQEPSSSTVTPNASSSLTTNYTSYDCTGERLLIKQDANLNNWTTSYVGDPFWRPTSTTDAMGNTTSYTYTPSTKNVSLTVASGSVEDTLSQVDSMGRQQLSQVKLNGTSNYSITETDRDINGRVSRRTIPFTGAAGTLNSSVAAYTYTYDGLDRMLTETSPPYSSTIPGTTKSYQYIANDTMTTVSPAASGENTKSTEIEVNGLGELTSVCEITTAPGSSSCGQANSSAVGFLTTYAYYPGGKLQKITQNAAGTTTQVRSFTYDNSDTGRMLTATTPESGITSTTYDTDPAGTCPPFTGFPIKTVDNGGGTTCIGYDLADRVVSMNYPTGLNSTSTPNKGFIYDSTASSSFSCSKPNAVGAIAEAYTTSGTAGQLTNVLFDGGTLTGTNSGLSDSGSTITQYDSATGTLGTVSFTTGSLASGSLQVGGTFNGGGSVVVTTNGTDGTNNGVDFSGSFVGASAWNLVTLADGTHEYTLTASVTDSSGEGGTLSVSLNEGKGFYNGDATITGGSLSFSPGSLLTDEGFCYDADGRRSDAFLWTSAGYGVYEHTSESYYPDGQVNSLSIPTQPTINYSLDPNGRVLSATASSGLSPILTSVSYYDNGLPNVVTLGTADTSTYSPWANLQPNIAAHTIGTSSNNTISHTLTWNSNGTLASLATSDQLYPANSQTCSFTYDDLERIVTDSCGSNWNESSSYDVFGNVTKSGSAPWPTSGSYNQSTNQYSSSSFVYDANGRLTNDSFDALGWDVSGNLINQSGTNFVYDAFNRPVMGTTNQYLYGPKGDLVAVENISGVVTKMFVSLPMSRAVYVSGVLDHYDRYDWQHSVRVASTASRTVYSDTSYDAFGIPYWSAGTLNSQYAGLGSDISSGTEQVSLTRRYHPTQGRWISPDSWGLAAVDMANPQSFNRYAYVGNNPLMRTDPGGQCWPPSACGLILMNWGNQLANFGQRMGSGGSMFISVGDMDAAAGNFLKAIGNGLTVGSSSGAAWDSGDPYQRTLALADDMGKVGSDILLLAPVGQAVNSTLAPVAETTLSLSPTADATLSGTSINATATTTNTALRAVAPTGQFGGYFSSTTNAAGGTVWTSVGTIEQSDFAPLVNDALLQGDPVNIISGMHFDPVQGLTDEPGFFVDDVNAFGNTSGSVSVYYYPNMTEGQVTSLLNGPGTTICATCNSGILFGPSISGLGDLGEDGISGLGQVPDE
jgi:RHS repeat-associated protein